MAQPLEVLLPIGETQRNCLAPGFGSATWGAQKQVEDLSLPEVCSHRMWPALKHCKSTSHPLPNRNLFPLVDLNCRDLDKKMFY